MHECSGRQPSGGRGGDDAQGGAMYKGGWAGTGGDGGEEDAGSNIVVHCRRLYATTGTRKFLLVAQKNASSNKTCPRRSSTESKWGCNKRSPIADWFSSILWWVRTCFCAFYFAITVVLPPFFARQHAISTLSIPNCTHLHAISCTNGTGNKPTNRPTKRMNTWTRSFSRIPPQAFAQPLPNVNILVT